MLPSYSIDYTLPVPQAEVFIRLHDGSILLWDHLGGDTPWAHCQSLTHKLMACLSESEALTLVGDQTLLDAAREGV